MEQLDFVEKKQRQLSQRCIVNKFRAILYKFKTTLLLGHVFYDSETDDEDIVWRRELWDEFFSFLSGLDELSSKSQSFFSKKLAQRAELLFKFMSEERSDPPVWRALDEFCGLTILSRGEVENAVRNMVMEIKSLLSLNNIREVSQGGFEAPLATNFTTAIMQSLYEGQARV